MMVWVEYITTVNAHVDLDTETVTRVVVDDENITYQAVYLEGFEITTDDGVISAAAMIADNSDWPGWEFGF